MWEDRLYFFLPIFLTTFPQEELRRKTKGFLTLSDCKSALTIIYEVWRILETRTDVNGQFLEKLYLSWCLHQTFSRRSVVNKFLSGLSVTMVELRSLLWLCYGHSGNLLEVSKKIPNGLLVDVVEGGSLWSGLFLVSWCCLVFYPSFRFFPFGFSESNDFF